MKKDLQDGIVKKSKVEKPVVIVGAGLAGLSAAYKLQQAPNHNFIVYEKGSFIGGHSRTEKFKDFRFDLGGHRFYTKKKYIENIVRKLIGKDVLTVDRLSRILFKGRFVDYPLSAFNTLRALGIYGACKAIIDYLLVKSKNVLSKKVGEVTFEEWALNRFGKYLYNVYFKIYTEKMWGVPCDELSADFAEQRIKGLSFREAIKDALTKKGDSVELIRSFLYPRFGFGEIPKALARTVLPPNRIILNHEVVEVSHDGERILSVKVQGKGNAKKKQECSSLINCMPLGDFLRTLKPAAPEGAIKAADELIYREIVILLLTLNVERITPDHWIYISSGDIPFIRIHEPKNWSPEMSPPKETSLVIEFSCTEGDRYWEMKPNDLAEEGISNLVKMGLIKREWVTDFTTARMKKAYPVYKVGYTKHLDEINKYLSRFSNLYNIGRNPSFVYNSGDHYMDMGIKAAENILGHRHDLSKIGLEHGYAETWNDRK